MPDNEHPIRFRSPSEDRSCERRTPKFRVLVLADLAPGYSGGRVALNRDNFRSIFESLAPELHLEVPDRISGRRRNLKCVVRISGLDAFHPDSLVEAMPLLAGLSEARRLLDECLRRQVRLEDVRGEILGALADTELATHLVPAPSDSRTPTAPPPSEDRGVGDAVDLLLDQVVVPEAAAGRETPSDLVGLLAAAVAPSAPPMDRPGLESLVREIDVRLSRQIAAICAQPAFSALESAWLGLKFLVDRLDFRAPVELEILPAQRSEFLERFFENVFHSEYECTSETPLSAVIADFSFGRSGPDLDTLRDMARLGASLSVLFVGAMDPSFWGVRQPAVVAKLPDLVQKAQGSEYAKWNRFRSESDAEWVVLTANRFVLRNGWAAATKRPTTFEWVGGEDSEEPLWGSAVWALGAAMGRSFADGGLRFPLVGPHSSGLLENLPVTIRANSAGERRATPLEVDFDDRRAYELAQVGFAPLGAQPGTDACHFNLVPSCKKPARYDDEEATRASFLSATVPYRLFAGAVAHEVSRYGRKIGGGVSPDAIVDGFRETLTGLLAPFEEEQTSPEAVLVEIEDNVDDAGLLDVTVRVRPGFQIYGSDVDLIVGTSVAR